MIRGSRLAAAVAVSSLLSACGGSHAGIPSAPHTQLVPSTLTMHWPAKRASSAMRRPAEISPSAQSIVVEVNNDPSLTSITNRPAGTAATASTVTLLTPPGNDTFVFSVYDGQNGAGNELGQQTVVQTIASGTNNTINATIDALVASVQIAPLANQPSVTPTTDPNGNPAYSILGDLPVTFAATPYDADGNVIVGPGDAITYNGSTLNTSIGITPVNGQPNQFAVRTNAAPGTNLAGFTITATDGQGTFAQSNCQLVLNAMTYVAYENSGAGSIVALDGNGNPVTLTGTFPGLQDPKGIAYDSADRRLYVADKAANTVLAFNSDGTAFTGTYAPPSLNAPIGIAYDDHNGELYVLDANGVHAMNTDGSAAPVTTTATPFANLNQPTAIALYEVPPNTYWLLVTNAGNNEATRYDELGNAKTAGVVPRAYISLGTLVPTGLVEDLNLNGLVFTGNVSGSPEMAAYGAGGGSVLATQTAGLSAPAGVAHDVFTGQVYAVNATSGAITIYDGKIAGLVQTLVAPPSLSKPSALTFVY